MQAKSGTYLCCFWKPALLFLTRLFKYAQRQTTWVPEKREHIKDKGEHNWDPIQSQIQGFPPFPMNYPLITETKHWHRITKVLDNPEE